MEKLVLKVLLTSSLLLLGACSGSEITEVSAIDGNTPISGNYNTYSNSKIEGSGTLRFNETLPIVSSRSIALKASLDSTIASSSVTVVLYSSSMLVPANTGIAVTFTRSGSNVIAQISFNGNGAQVKGSNLAFYFPTSLDVIIDVHNINNKARVLVWRRNAIEYTALNADFDSNESTDLESTLPYQTGGGGFAGLILQNATVTSATIGAQKTP